MVLKMFGRGFIYPRFQWKGGGILVAMEPVEEGAGFADRLEAIASPSRLELLEKLRRAKPISEIELKATTGPGSANRCISREGIRHHLSKLREAGLVDVRPARTTGRHEHEYHTRSPGLYGLAESLRTMASHGTHSSGAKAPITWTSGTGTPRLLVVHGAQIGARFRLGRSPSTPGRGWVLGQSPKADFDLPWDPKVEEQAAEIVDSSDGYAIVDLRAATHRVSLNGRELDRGEKQGLEHGDVIGIGRSLLAFQTG